MIKKQVFAVAALLLLQQVCHAVEVGRPLPNMSLPLLTGTVAGEITDFRAYRGKLVYLDIWASWCGPCRQSLPILNEIRKDFGEFGFEVVAVNVDENLSDALKFLKAYPVDYPVLLDPKGALPRAYDILGMPTSYLIDEHGVVIYQHTGFKKADRKKIEALIRKHLPR